MITFVQTNDLIIDITTGARYLVTGTGFSAIAAKQLGKKGIVMIDRYRSEWFALIGRNFKYKTNPA